VLPETACDLIVVLLLISEERSPAVRSPE